jgi:hypothetical protein
LRPDFSGIGDRSMAKVPGGKGSSKAAAGSSGKSGSGDVAHQAKTGVKGNGNRTAQAEMDLTVEAPEEEAQAAEPARPAETASRSAVPGAADSAAGEPALPGPAVAAPAMRELGLTRKEMWKVDLKGKRIALDEKAWREELPRALGRAPAKP